MLRKVREMLVNVQALLRSFWLLTKKVISLIVDAAKMSWLRLKTIGLCKTRGARTGAIMALLN